MDKSLLLKREPILMFAEIPLYESELDDNGSSQLCTKVGFPCLRGNQLISLGLTPVEPDEDSSAGVLYAANLRCFKRATHGQSCSIKHSSFKLMKPWFCDLINVVDNKH